MVKTTPWPERDAELIELSRDKTLAQTDIARRMKLTAGQVRGRMHRLDLRADWTQEDFAALRALKGHEQMEDPERAPWPAWKVKRLRELVCDGKLSWKQRAEALEVTSYAARCKAKALQLKVAPRQGGRKSDGPKVDGRALLKARRDEARRVQLAQARAEKARLRREAAAAEEKPAGPPDNVLIAEFLAKRAVTKCPPRYATGSVGPQYVGNSWKAA
jgi:hypothetical protein